MATRAGALTSKKKTAVVVAQARAYDCRDSHDPFDSFCVWIAGQPDEVRILYSFAQEFYSKLPNDLLPRLCLQRGRLREERRVKSDLASRCCALDSIFPTWQHVADAAHAVRHTDDVSNDDLRGLCVASTQPVPRWALGQAVKRVSAGLATWSSKSHFLVSLPRAPAGTRAGGKKGLGGPCGLEMFPDVYRTPCGSGGTTT